MNRLKNVFAELHTKGKKGLIPYLTAGDPHPDYTVPLMHQLVESGADVIELGVPFSDPMADGPTIQAACERALRHGVSLNHVLQMVERFRKDNQHTPVVLMGYQNPIEMMGATDFAKAAARSGVDGVLTVDLPPEEARDFVDCYRENDISPIFLVAPTTQTKRIELISSHASGFLYYVSFKGVTGANRLDVSLVKSKVETMRKHTALPIAVGFGIKDAKTACEVAKFANAVVIGSMIVAKLAETCGDVERLCQQVHESLAPIRSALDSLLAQQSVA